MHNQQYLDTLTFSHQLYDEIPRELEFRATTVAEAEAWQCVLRHCIDNYIPNMLQYAEMSDII